MDFDILCNTYDRDALERVVGHSLEGFDDGGRALLVPDGSSPRPALDYDGTPLVNDDGSPSMTGGWLRVRVDTNTYADLEDPGDELAELVPFALEIAIECFSPEAEAIVHAMFAEVGKVSKAALVKNLTYIIDRTPGPSASEGP